MLSLDAAEWKGFEGGYRVAYDASVPLKKLESSDEPSREIWDELWDELHHQGDVGVASYAAVPQIFRIYREKGWVDFHLPAFASTIEEARHSVHNPPLPKWLEADYLGSLCEVAHYCLEKGRGITDRDFTKSVVILAAVLMREFALSRLIETIDEGDEERVLEFYCENF